MPPPAPPGISLSLSRWVSILGLGRTTVAAPLRVASLPLPILGHVNRLVEPPPLWCHMAFWPIPLPLRASVGLPMHPCPRDLRHKFQCVTRRCIGKSINRYVPRRAVLFLGEAGYVSLRPSGSPRKTCVVRRKPRGGENYLLRCPSSFRPSRSVCPSVVGVVHGRVGS